MTLSASYWAADRSQQILGLTVGDALRDAAAEVPDTTDAALLDRGGGVPAYTVGQGPEIRTAGAFPRPGA